MKDTTIVDARGLSCPQPALMASQAIKNIPDGKLTVLVDSDTARENVSRLAKKAGWNVELSGEADGSTKITLSK